MRRNSFCSLSSPPQNDPVTSCVDPMELVQHNCIFCRLPGENLENLTIVIHLQDMVKPFQPFNHDHRRIADLANRCLASANLTLISLRSPYCKLMKEPIKLKYFYIFELHSFLTVDIAGENARSLRFFPAAVS